MISVLVAAYVYVIVLVAAYVDDNENDNDNDNDNTYYFGTSQRARQSKVSGQWQGKSERRYCTV